MDKASNYFWLIDAGHGGITPSGIYTTAPAKMKVFEDGFTVYEGQVNRQIAEKLYKLLDKVKINYALVYDNVADTSLFERYTLVNKIYAKNHNAILLDIHSNASMDKDGDGNGDGQGLEVWTSIGETKSDVIAEHLCKIYKKHFPNFKFRADKADGDLDKEAKFAMVTKTNCPAVLVENLFFDNRTEAEYLVSHEGQTAIADALLEWILEMEEIKPV